MTLRDRVEATLRSWNLYEVDRGAPPVVDYDCCTQVSAEVAKAASRLAVREQLQALYAEASDAAGGAHVIDRIGASLAYLDALLGVRAPLAEYIQATQGCAARGWSDDHVERVRSVAVSELDKLGVSWDADTVRSVVDVEGPVDAADASDLVQAYARDLEDDVRRVAGSNAPFNVTVEHVDLDVYWAYWLDGTGANVRLRINRRNASFTEVQARQFALHELLGHGLQCASYSEQCKTHDVPWVRMTAVHAQQQVLLEGLAQALPLFVRPDDQPLIMRVRLAHYLELVRAKLHLAINAGESVPRCVEIARAHVPFWSESAVGDMLADRSVNPLLRSYLWAYPAGIDWFVRLADEAPGSTAEAVMRASYSQPLTPALLSNLWANGPRFGGGS